MAKLPKGEFRAHEAYSKRVIKRFVKQYQARKERNKQLEATEAPLGATGQLKDKTASVIPSKELEEIEMH